MLIFSKPSIAKPLALGVNPKIKATMWADEYVDLGTLLNSKFPRARFTVVEPYEGGMAWEKQKPPTYRFDSVAHWLSAFHIFVSIYCEKYPHEACSLMKFANTIQVLARRSCDIAAFVYDRNFRMWREIYYVNLPWDLVHSELHGDAIALGLKIKLEAKEKHPENQGLHKSPFLGSKTHLGKYPQMAQENGPSATVSTQMTGNANGGQVAPTHTYVKNVGGNIVRKHVQTPIDTKILRKDALEPTNQQNREHSPTHT